MDSFMTNAGDHETLPATTERNNIARLSIWQNYPRLWQLAAVLMH
jgi:hypothetical protein